MTNVVHPSLKYKVSDAVGVTVLWRIVFHLRTINNFLTYLHHKERYGPCVIWESVTTNKRIKKKFHSWNKQKDESYGSCHDLMSFFYDTLPFIMRLGGFYFNPNFATFLWKRHIELDSIKR